MKQPDDVTVMLRLHELGWGYKRIGRELGVSPNTVRGWLRAGGWRPYKSPKRDQVLDGREEWLRTQFLKHGGNADVVHQLLAKEGVEVSLRTVERAVVAYREEVRVEAEATTRFETAPGQQLQVDFTQAYATIAGKRERVYVCVLTLGYSRRLAAFAWSCERQAQWFLAMEHAFARFGVPRQMLVDNARALVDHHNVETREVKFNEKFLAFCKHWDVVPRACAPYRARTKGKVERSCGYVKRNGIAGREFASWEALQGWLDAWCRDVADQRVHGTTGERPADRYERSEAEHLRKADRPSFLARREVRRRVGDDYRVEMDTNRYTVPYVHIGRWVKVRVEGTELSVRRMTDDDGAEPIARHVVARGRNQDVRDPAHAVGLMRAPVEVDEPVLETDPLARALSVYDDAVGGAL